MVKSESAGYFPYLDYVRAAASLGVLASHTDPMHVLPESFGNASVQVFFALSGFLIGGILLNSKPADLPRFYFNRATRIWIPYFLAILLVLAVTILKQPLRDAKLWEILLYKVTFVYSIFGTPQLANSASRFPLAGTANHFWSICVEEQFYLLAPFVIVFLRRVVATIAVCLVVLNFLVPHNFASISLGLLLAYSSKTFREWHLRRHAQIAMVVLSIAILILLSRLPDMYGRLFPLAAICIVALCARRGRQQTSGRILGGMSFSLYLDAWIAFFAANYAAKLLDFQIGSVGLIFIATVGALVLSFVHYQAIDRQIAERRSRWYSDRMGTLLCAGAIGLVLTGLGAGFYFQL